MFSWLLDRLLYGGFDCDSVRKRFGLDWWPRLGKGTLGRGASPGCELPWGRFGGYHRWASCPSLSGRSRFNSAPEHRPRGEKEAASELPGALLRLHPTRA